MPYQTGEVVILDSIKSVSSFYKTTDGEMQAYLRVHTFSPIELSLVHTQLSLVSL